MHQATAELRAEERNLADVYRQLMEAQMRQFNNTREIKWKVNLALWTFLAVVIHASLSARNPLSLSYYLAWGGFALLVILHALWMFYIQSSLNFDKKRWTHYREMVHQVCKSSEQGQDGRAEITTEWWSWSMWRWVVIESGVTLLLGSIAAYAISKQCG